MLLVRGVLLVALISVWGLWRFQSAPLTTTPVITAYQLTVPSSSAIDWPAYGQSAIASSSYGVVATHGEIAPQPTASTAKLITMLAVMKKKSFHDGAGEHITFTQADVDRYSVYVAGNGSVTPVSVGLTWTQYQAMEAVLLQSANNVADSLAIWAFGSLESYRAYAQNMVKELGMDHTTIGSDASGYHPSTTSTAGDLAILAGAVLKEPMLRHIVATKSVELPGTGLITNTNHYLGDEVIGMKTGYTPEAGGVFVLAGLQHDGTHTQEIMTVVMGAPGSTSAAAQTAAYALYQSAAQNFHYQTIITQGAVLASYKPSWSNSRYDVVADDSVGTFVWSGGSAPRVQIQAPSIMDGSQAQVTATVVYGNSSQHVSGYMNAPVPSASWWWRVFGH